MSTAHLGTSVSILGALALLFGCNDARWVAEQTSPTRQPSRTTPAASVSVDAGPSGDAGGTAGDAGQPDASAGQPLHPALVERAILVSVDGLGAKYLEAPLAEGTLRSFIALTQAGSYTLNARADYDYTITLPSHTSMITGRPIARDLDLPVDVHHGWTGNGVPAVGATLHNGGNPSLSYIASVFDVAHDRGKSTCLYAGKTKFMLFPTSYDGVNGAPDVTGPDDGRNKIDRVVILENNTEQLISFAEADIRGGVCDFAFIHIADLDTPLGHSTGWGSASWLAGLTRVDGWLGRLLELTNPMVAGATVGLVVTADHGGVGADHSNAVDEWNYRIPFFVVAPGFPAKRELYSLLEGKRRDPLSERPRNVEPLQPVRHADAANVITSLLGLPEVPGSYFRDLWPAE